jgi:hypothetical protein
VTPWIIAKDHNQRRSGAGYDDEYGVMLGVVPLILIKWFTWIGEDLVDWVGGLGKTS